MASSSKIKIMISSRCLDKFPLDTSSARILSEIRKDLKERIEKETLFGNPVFEVWINEASPSKAGSKRSLEVCLTEVRGCDVLLVLYNGNAGWLTKTEEPGGTGICHAELMHGHDHAPGKLFLVDISQCKSPKFPKRKADKRFQKYVKSLDMFRGAEVTMEASLQERCLDGLHEAVTRLARLGVREASKGKFHSGQALDWSRLGFSDRRAAMSEVVVDLLTSRNNAVMVGDNAVVEIDGMMALTVVDAVPAAMTVAAAREMVGQPFLRDHDLADGLGSEIFGPIHLIACHKSATEAQAMRLLGFPDATLVTAPFGIFVADSVQKIQIALITNCRDESNTRFGVQRFFEWLEQTGEAELVAERAKARARIVGAIAAEAT